MIRYACLSSFWMLAVFWLILPVFESLASLSVSQASAQIREPVFDNENLPEPLNAHDVILYKEIFALQEIGKLSDANALIGRVKNNLLMGHVKAQRYLHPTAYRSKFSELRDWLSIYNDHPDASRIKWLADKRKPKKAAAAKKPKPGYLKGVGTHLYQNWRPYIPMSRSGRASPRKTAQIAADIRRMIRRKQPTNANEYLSQNGNRRYLTAVEEATLRGEIAHGYFIFGLDDKAIRAARQAIAKGKDRAYMAYWAGGLAAWRTHQYDLSGMFFRTLAEIEEAPDVLRSGAAFWAHRLELREGRPGQAMAYLEIAAQYPKRFYGMMALQAAGQMRTLDFSLPPLSEDFAQWLTDSRGGRRILGLLQVGENNAASRELRYLFPAADAERRRDIMIFALRHNMPGLAFRVADVLRQDTGEIYYAALYPEPIIQQRFQVDPALVWAIARKESSFIPTARSSVRATGMMQLMPATAAFVTQDRRYRNSHRHLLHDPELNLEIAQKYIVHLLNERIVDGSLVRLLAAYNGGPGNLSKWLRKIDYPDDVYLLIEGLPARETRNYIKSVLTDMSFYRLKYGQDTPVLRDVVSAGRKADHVNLLLGMNIPKLATP